MKITKLQIKNLFGISEMSLDEKSVELTGPNGIGKSSVLDAIRYALTNNSDRDCVIKQGEKEGEIIIETDTGLMIDRKKRTNKADYKSVKENKRDVNAPENFLRSIFQPLQLDPIAFTQLSAKEQNRAILELVNFDWDLNWIKEKFGELPEVNYDQHILQVLYDIQSEKGDYFRQRQDINRDIRNKRAFIEDIAKDIPAHYQADKWKMYDLSGKYSELSKINDENAKIEKAHQWKETYENKKRGIDANREIAFNRIEKETGEQRTTLSKQIEQLKAEIALKEQKLNGLESTAKIKRESAEKDYKLDLQRLDLTMEKATEYDGMELTDTTELREEIDSADEMKSHLSEYERMIAMQSEVEKIEEDAAELTNKINLARELPGEILQEAEIPVEGLSVVDGQPMIKGLPITNLSDGEKLSLCVDVAIAKENNLQLILLDGVERLTTENRELLYKKCKEKGLQFIATRTEDSNDLEVVYFE